MNYKGKPAISEPLNDEVLANFQRTNRMLVKTGTIMLDSCDDLALNYAVCNGQAVSRNEFPVLWSAIGTKFGEGDGHSTFNLPNLEPPIPSLRYVIFLGLDKELIRRLDG